ncbi:MAG TPA: hypothetical protein VIG08_18060 [Gemmatimonadales bacterium]|jgi:hypothetical protein
MTECERLSDRTPDIALGRSTWSAEEQAHLDACLDCRAEYDLVVMTNRLGAGVPRLSSPDIMTAALLGRLAAERATRARRRKWVAVGLAAAAVAILAVWMPRSPSGVATPTLPGPETPVAVLLPELEGLPDDELNSILGSLDESSASSPFDSTGLDQADDHELEQVLEAWEG